MTTNTDTDQTRAASWHGDAQPINDSAAGLTIGQLMDRTGLSQATIRGAYLKKRPVADSNPLSAIARPAYRFGSEPRWSAEQVETFHQRTNERERSFNVKYGDLPQVTRAQARARKLVTLRACSVMTGKALTTLHRWATTKDFPEPVAIIGNMSPSPRVLREWPEVRKWILAFKPDLVLPETPVYGPEDQDDAA